MVEGKVVDHDTDSVVRGAAVSLGAGPQGLRGRGTRVTDDEGRFRFRDVPEGTYRLSVTVQGYRSMDDTLQVADDGDLDLILPLSIDPIRLEPIVVTARRLSPIPGYEQRRRMGGARFLITREDIEESRPRFLSELLHTVPGGMVVPTPPHGYSLLLRGQCRPGIWVDGVEMSGVGSVDQLMSPHDVEAVEVYHGFELPVELGVNPCGGILIWTRSGPSASQRERSAGDDEEGRNIFGQLIKVTAIVIGIMLATR